MLNALPKPSSFAGLPPLPREIKALLLDDSNFDRARIKRISNRTALCIEMDEVDSIAALDQAVAAQNYDVILIDYRLPVGDGLEALDLLQRNELNKDTAKIMITGDHSRETADQALSSGCHDFLSKDEINAEALRRAVLNAVTLARQQQLLLQTRQAQPKHEPEQALPQEEFDPAGNVVSFVRKRLLGFLPDGTPRDSRASPAGSHTSDLDGEGGFTIH